MTTPKLNMPGDAVQAYFERAAGDFDRLYAQQRQTALMRWINRRFRRDIAERFLMTCDLAEQLRPESVLDVGCGSGRYLSALASMGVKRLVGVDVSTAMIELAQQEMEGRPGAQVDLVQTEFLDWETDEQFDLVVAMGLYDYIANPAVMLARMRSLARQAVIVSFPSRHWFRTPVRRFRYFLKRCPVRFFDEDEIQPLGREAGFARTDVTKIRGAGMDYVAIFWCDQ
jgi:2-polyprenyl-3-methyl-5-hydroxy-6-metoxy-1,4-benzoquinol methylase